MSAVLFDIGNSRIKWGLRDANGLRRAGSLAHRDVEADSFSGLLATLPRHLERAIASNVAGRRVAADLARAIDDHAGLDIEFVTSTEEACGVANGYETPARLGVDRWVACIGAWSHFRRALLVVDAGTATTLDAVDSRGRHLGGLILPGLVLMGRALDMSTSDIGTDGSGAEDPEPEDLFGHNTEQAVRNGAITAVCGAMERARRVMEERDSPPLVVLTGGDAPRILRQWHTDVEHRPDLVLEGLAALMDAT